MSMKQQLRVLGIDDSPFGFGDSTAMVIGALVRVPNYLESVMRTEVAVDGIDASKKVTGMVLESRYRDQIKLILIDGIALAGFNVLDIDYIHSSLEIPVLTVTRDKPDFAKIRAALMKYFPDWRDRFDLLTRHILREIPTEHKPLFASGLGLEWREFEELVKMSTVRGAVPEPLRVAHLIASAMVRGESYGRP
jgi:endonuclease V-like protein UPF0215 family